jgi:uncharacterized membrane protein
METATQQGTRGSGATTGYLTGTDHPVRRYGSGGRITADGRQKEVNLAKARSADSLAQALGWFSIGLGVAQIAAPRRVARLIGINDDEGNKTVMRAVGVREIAAGLGLLSDPKPTGFAFARVVGDVMDLAMLGNALSSDRNDRGKTAMATAAVLGIGALDVLCTEQLKTTVPRVMHPVSAAPALRIKKSVTIRRPVEEVYAFWRNFENLPQFMHHLESVRNTGDRRSHWTSQPVNGVTTEWDVEVVEDRQNELIAWRTIGISEITGRGIVEFRLAPGGRGTEVSAELNYETPGGALGARVAKLFRDVPGVKLENELNILKQIMETGEEVRSDASIHKGPHPAQPPRGRVNFGNQATA